MAPVQPILDHDPAECPRPDEREEYENLHGTRGINAGSRPQPARAGGPAGGKDGRQAGERGRWPARRPQVHSRYIFGICFSPVQYGRTAAFFFAAHSGSWSGQSRPLSPLLKNIEFAQVSSHFS